MYKSIPIAPTVLAYPFLYGIGLLRVPVALYSVLAAKLAVGDWTYFRISGGGHAEIIKVIGLLSPDILVVRRGIDDTGEHSFLVGAVLEYVDTVAAVLDNYVSPALVLTPLGAITVNGLTVGYPELKFRILGASEVVGDNSHLVIGRKDNTYGCCNGSAVPAPLP